MKTIYFLNRFYIYLYFDIALERFNELNWLYKSIWSFYGSRWELYLGVPINFLEIVAYYDYVYSNKLLLTHKSLINIL